MVKDDYHKTRALTDGERDISIAHEMNVYTFIYKLQEETHRRAVRSTMEQKRKTLTHSTLEKIEGIGAAKAKKLLARYTLKALRSLSVEELSAVKGISERDARAIFEHFHKSEKGEKTV
jgi:excinuclease ABC subunit C